MGFAACGIFKTLQLIVYPYFIYNLPTEAWCEAAPDYNISPKH